MHAETLQALLMQVRVRGSAQIHRKQLFWLCGRKNESESVYELILGSWEKIGGQRDALHLFWVGEEYTLLAGPAYQVTLNYDTNWQTPGIAA